MRVSNPGVASTGHAALHHAARLVHRSNHGGHVHRAHRIELAQQLAAHVTHFKALTTTLSGTVGFGKALAMVFAIMCVGSSFGGGYTFQVNQAVAQVVAVTGDEGSPAKLIWIALINELPHGMKKAAIYIGNTGDTHQCHVSFQLVL